jgi:Na+/glutamate symporter
MNIDTVIVALIIQAFQVFFSLIVLAEAIKHNPSGFLSIVIFQFVIACIIMGGIVAYYIVLKNRIQNNNYPVPFQNDHDEDANVEFFDHDEEEEASL